MLPPDSSPTQPVSPPPLDPNDVRRGNRSATVTLVIFILVVIVVGCGGLLALSQTPFGQQALRSTDATDTAQAAQTPTPTPLSANNNFSTTPTVTNIQPTRTATAKPTSTARPSPSSTVRPTPTSKPLPTATAAPKPTPLPVVSPNAATVGGSVAGFNNAFGGGNLHTTGGVWNWSGPGGTTYVSVYTEEDGSSWGPNSPHRVFEVSTQLESTDYTTAQANAVVPHFLPSDAKFVGNGSPPPQQDGIVTIYFSQMLANTLPASDFKDQNGNAVRPGTIFVFLSGPTNYFFNVVLGTDESSEWF